MYNKTLTIPHITEKAMSVEEAGTLLRREPSHSVAEVNWPDSNVGEASVSVSLGYGGGDLYLLWEVEEPTVLAEKSEPNSAVCQDSCVELFFAPESNRYINVEINAIGTVLAQRGRDRAHREYLTPERIAQIRRTSSLGSTPFRERSEPATWRLTVAIPLTLLEVEEETLPGQSFRANFYKCGDYLSRPHYLTWNPVPIPKPDFHRPDHFGTLMFT